MPWTDEDIERLKNGQLQFKDIRTKPPPKVAPAPAPAATPAPTAAAPAPPAAAPAPSAPSPAFPEDTRVPSEVGKAAPPSAPAAPTSDLSPQGDQWFGSQGLLTPRRLGIIGSQAVAGVAEDAAAALRGGWAATRGGVTLPGVPVRGAQYMGPSPSYLQPDTVGRAFTPESLNPNTVGERVLAGTARGAGEALLTGNPFAVLSGMYAGGSTAAMNQFMPGEASGAISSALPLSGYGLRTAIHIAAAKTPLFGPAIGMLAHILPPTRLSALGFGQSLFAGYSMGDLSGPGRGTNTPENMGQVGSAWRMMNPANWFGGGGGTAAPPAPAPAGGMPAGFGGTPPPLPPANPPPGSLMTGGPPLSYMGGSPATPLMQPPPMSPLQPIVPPDIQQP